MSLGWDPDFGCNIFPQGRNYKKDRKKMLSSSDYLQTKFILRDESAKLLSLI